MVDIFNGAVGGVDNVELIVVDSLDRKRVEITKGSHNGVVIGSIGSRKHDQIIKPDRDGVRTDTGHDELGKLRGEVEAYRGVPDGGPLKFIKGFFQIGLEDHI